MASIIEKKDKNGKIYAYRVQIRLKGRPPQVGTFKSKTKAKRWAEETEAAIRDGRYFKTTEARKHTLGELIDRYILDVLPSKSKVEEHQKAQLIWWKSQIGDYLLSDITPAIIAEQRDKLARENTKRGTRRAPATVGRYLAAISHAFTIAMKEWGWVEDSPMRRVTKPKEPRGRVRFLSDEERKSLLEACQNSSNPYLHTIVVLALSTGMRQGEIMNLRWSDVDFQRGRITLHETKNGERRVVSITGLAFQLLQKLDKGDSHFLFPGKNPKQPMDIRFPWEIALKASAIKDLTLRKKGRIFDARNLKGRQLRAAIIRKIA